jgi:hypothetical protein
MREEFTSSNSKDFGQRYVGTFGWFEKPDGGKVMVLVGSISKEYVTFYDKNNFEYTAKADMGNVFSFLPVQKGLYEYQDDIVFISRVPARQWKRGICLDNTSVRSFNRGLSQIDFSYNLLEKIFGENEDTLLQKFKENYSGNLLLGRSFVIYNNLCYIYNNIIGSYSPTTTTIYLTNSLFLQEITDILRMKNLPLLVTAGE